MWAKLSSSGEVIEYPYTLAQLRQDYPTTSFPLNAPGEDLAAYGVVTVVPVPRPFTDFTQSVVEGLPVAEDGTWQQNWIITPASEEELAERTTAQSAQVRAERNAKLTTSDWTQVDDAPLSNLQKAAWASYRQSLRDITAQPGFPWTVSWPSLPA